MAKKVSSNATEIEIDLPPAMILVPWVILEKLIRGKNKDVVFNYETASVYDIDSEGVTFEVTQ